MCTGSEQAHAGIPATVADALAMTGAGLDYLNSAAAAGLAAAALGDVVASMGELQAKFTAAWAGLLRQFDAAGAHDIDGYGSTAAWLIARTQMSRKDARADVSRMRLLGRQPGVAAALAAGQVS